MPPVPLKGVEAPLNPPNWGEEAPSNLPPLGEAMTWSFSGRLMDDGGGRGAPLNPPNWGEEFLLKKGAEKVA